MGEVLRAIMDANCIDSRSAFYTNRVDYQSLAVGSPANPRSVTSTIQCKSDVWFLAMALTQNYALSVDTGVGNWGSRSAVYKYNFYNGNDQVPYSGPVPQPQITQNYNANNLVTMDEYVLFGPRELIVCNQIVPQDAGGVARSRIFWVNLLGVEFRMPSNFQGFRNG